MNQGQGRGIERARDGRHGIVHEVHSELAPSVEGDASKITMGYTLSLSEGVKIESINNVYCCLMTENTANPPEGSPSLPNPTWLTEGDGGTDTWGAHGVTSTGNPHWAGATIPEGGRVATYVNTPDDPWVHLDPYGNLWGAANEPATHWYLKVEVKLEGIEGLRSYHNIQRIPDSSPAD